MQYMYRLWITIYRITLNNFVREHSRALTLVVSGVVLFMAVAFLLWLLVGPDNPKDKIAFIQTLGGLVGGAALATGLYFTARNLQVNREGQITERFTRAIDQLGATENNSKQLEIRLGGIYALERIARDSEQDHWPIMEVLTAYVRQHSPRKRPEATREEGAAESEHAGSGSTRSSNDSVGRVLDADTQAIITVIRRRTRSFGRGEPESLDLHYTYLHQANLIAANLMGADLRGATLDASLEGANLQGANLWGANLRGAFLTRANLQGATGLTQEQINQAFGDNATVLPEGFVHPEHWIKSTDEPPNGEE